MPNPFVPLAAPGPRLVDGQNIQDLANNDVNICSGPLTALAGGGNTSATPVLNQSFADVRTCATNSDSVILPPAKQGMLRFVPNLTGQTLKVLGNGSDTINSVAGATGVTQATTIHALYFCAHDGEWRRILSA